MRTHRTYTPSALLVSIGMIVLFLLTACGTTQRSPVSTIAAQTPAPTEVPVTPMPTSAPLELTSIGSDGNVWEQAVPNGTPKQWTNQARRGMVRYSGLAWSPDGSRLAVLRTADLNTQHPTYTLLLLSAEGTVVHSVSLPGAPVNMPFAWSPDGQTIAYRVYTGEFTVQGGIAKLVLIAAINGTMLKSLDYLLFEGDGCGGGGWGPLTGAVLDQHHVGLGGLDTFAWSPDQHSILVAHGCGGGPAVQIDLQTGATKSGFPIGARYQPSGTLILGSLGSGGGTIGLFDGSGKQVRTLVKNPDATTSPDALDYALLVGCALWSQDGQSIYYEYDDSIWHIQADGSQAHIVVPGTGYNQQMQATVQMLGALAENGQTFLALQLQGRDEHYSTRAVVRQWSLVQADGTHPTLLPSGIAEVVYRPN